MNELPQKLRALQQNYPDIDTVVFSAGRGQFGSVEEPEDVAEAVSYVLNSRAQIVVDEINLSPLNKVVKFKKIVSRTAQQRLNFQHTQLTKSASGLN